MSATTTGLIVSTDPDVVETLRPEVRPLVGVLRSVDGFDPAIRICREHAPELMIFDLHGDTRPAMQFLRQVRCRFPETAVILVAKEKNPDTILEGLRLGLADFWVRPVRAEDIRTTVRRVLNKEKTMPPAGEVIALFSLKGGQGVTSLAVNVADQIQALLPRRKVLLLDLNLYMGEIGTYLDQPAGYTPFDLLRDIERVDENLLFSSLTRHPQGFYIMGAPEQINDAAQVRGEHVQQMLALLGDHFDYIVTDLPHSFADRTLAALEAAGQLLVVTIQDVAAIKSVQRSLELFSDLQYDHKIKIVLNRFSKYSEIGLKDLAHVLRRPVFAAVTNDYRRLSEATGKHRTVRQAHPKSRLHRDLRHLAGQLTGHLEQAGGARGMKRLLRKALGHETQ